METTIYNFHAGLYIKEIQKLEFHISHVQILGTKHCADSCRTEFKLRKLSQNMLCRRDYAERVFASFDHQIQLKYYSGNIYISIEVIALQHFSALPQTEINPSTKLCPRHAVFCSFLSDDSKQDAATPTAHIKDLIQLLKERKLLAS